MPRAITIDKDSPFFGESCALCKEPFAPGDDLVVCNECGTRHHSFCWYEAGNHCTAYGCTGRGEVIRPSHRSQPTPQTETVVAAASAAQVIGTPLTPASAPLVPPAAETRPAPVRRRPPQRRNTAQSRPRQTPVPEAAPQPLAWHTRLARSCLIVAIAIAIVVFAFGCFGLWAILDYLMLDVWHLPYRPIPQNGLIQFDTLQLTFHAITRTIMLT